MKLILFLTITIIFFHFNISGKNKRHDTHKYVIDTLSIKHDSILAKISTYRNGFLIEEKEAYLILDSFRTNRFQIRINTHRIPIWFSKKTMYVYDVIKHGNTTEYQLDKKRKITFYNYDKEILVQYYDKDNNEISENEYRGCTFQIGPCGRVGREIIVFEKKKKK
jgi:hypothetical protein